MAKLRRWMLLQKQDPRRKLRISMARDETIWTYLVNLHGSIMKHKGIIVELSQT